MNQEEENLNIRILIPHQLQAITYSKNPNANITAIWLTYQIQTLYTLYSRTEIRDKSPRHRSLIVTTQKHDRN